MFLNRRSQVRVLPGPPRSSLFVSGPRGTHGSSNAMNVAGKIVVVTGGGSGIGKAMCHAFHRAGAAKVVVADIDSAAADQVAKATNGRVFSCDVAQEAQLKTLIETTESDHGPIDLFCSNAGIASGFDQRAENAAAAPDEIWNRAWSLNVM